MLTSQRDLFDIPADVAYLNAASWSPLPRATQEAARAAVARKGQPWKLGHPSGLCVPYGVPVLKKFSTTAPAPLG